jgi:subfamily B ATP-binding cassette protein MsbA
LKPHRRLGILGGIVVLVNVLLQLPMPLLTMYLVDHVIIEKNFNTLHWVGISLTLFLFLKAGSSHLQAYVFLLFRNRVIYDIRGRIFEHLTRLPLSFFDRNQAGYLSSRVSTELNGLNSLMANTMIQMLVNLLTLLFGLVFAFWLNWKLALMAVSILPFYFMLLKHYNPILRTENKKRKELFSNVMGDVLETICCIFMVKSFMAETRELNKMLRSFRAALTKDLRVSMTSNLVSIISVFLTSLGKLALIWFGCLQIMKGDFTLGGFLAFNSFLKYIYDPIKSLAGLSTGIQNGLATADRLFELLDHPPESNGDGEQLSVNNGRIAFHKVNFTYGEELILKDVSFTVEPGMTVAVVGRSGSGKSTLVNLMMRFYEPSSGTISIDGTDISNVSLSSLRKNIAIIPQDTFLFTGDVWFNLRYGAPEATDDQVIEAAEKAHAHEFLKNLPQGYDTPIGERGTRLSGGQRQRVALAMAFLKDAPILILDEATSPLDTENEKLIRTSVTELTRGRTTFIVAHQLLTITHADLVLVMDKGRIVEMGGHNDLLEKNALYARLFSEILNNSYTSHDLETDPTPDHVYV